MTQFTDAPWDAGAVSASLDAEDYAKVCLIDMNPPNRPKTKALAKLPIRATPGGPVNTNALKSVASVLAGGMGGVDAPPAAKAAAARTTVRMMKEAKMDVNSDGLMKIAGMG